MLHVCSRPAAAARLALPLCFGLALVTGTRSLADPIKLDAAINRALAEHPDVARANVDIDIGEARRVTAGTRPFNPDLGFLGGPVRVAGTTFTNYEVSLGQVFELGGKRGKRVDVADAGLAATKARREWTRRAVILRVHRAYYLAALERTAVATAKEAQIAADEAKVATEERLRQKAGTQLEVNVAAANAGRAKRALLDAERMYDSARAELAAAIGARPSEDLEPADEPPPPPQLLLAEEALVLKALPARSDLVAVRKDYDTALAVVKLADSSAVPDLGLTIGYSREKDPDLTFDVFTVGISIPIPLFDRKQGERREARSALRRAGVEDQAARWQAEREIRTAYRGYQKARDAVQAFDLDVVGKLDENLKLAKESFQSGKIGLLEFNVVRADLVETRMAYLDARRQAIEALIALELAAGDVEVVR